MILLIIALVGGLIGGAIGGEVGFIVGFLFCLIGGFPGYAFASIISAPAEYSAKMADIRQREADARADARMEMLISRLDYDLEDTYEDTYVDARSVHMHYYPQSKRKSSK
jgi:hypothetical protein